MDLNKKNKHSIMRKIIIVIIVALSFKDSIAQTTNEWLKQKETQKKYLLQQIASFKLYLGYVQKGYSIAKKGLTTIGNIKKGDFALHNDFFSSFKSVNPKLQGYTKVSDIIAFQVKIVQTYKSTYKYIQSISLFTANEIDFIYKVFANLLDNSTSDIDELITIVTANKLEMRDDERIKRIEAIYETIQDKYAFAKSFGEEAKVLAMQREKEKNNIQSSRDLYGIKNE